MALSDMARRKAKATGKAVCLPWVEHPKLDLNEGRQSTLSQIPRIFNKNVVPTLGKLSI